MYQSKKNIICFILAIFLCCFSFSCIAMEAEAYRDVTVTADNEKQGVHQNLITKTVPDAGEVLSTCSLSVGTNTIHQFKVARKSVHLSWALLIVHIFIYSIIKIFVAGCFMEIPKIHKNKAILQYIHDLDGKK